MIIRRFFANEARQVQLQYFLSAKYNKRKKNIVGFKQFINQLTMPKYESWYKTVFYTLVIIIYLSTLDKK